jgi:hypothetical protein
LEFAKSTGRPDDYAQLNSSLLRAWPQKDADAMRVYLEGLRDYLNSDAVPVEARPKRSSKRKKPCKQDLDLEKVEGREPCRTQGEERSAGAGRAHCRAGVQVLDLARWLDSVCGSESGNPIATSAGLVPVIDELSANIIRSLMSLYRVSPHQLEPIDRTTFAAAGLFERKDLQRLLRKDITPIGANLIVIAEEFCGWEDSKRRIDLLCLSSDASLVVVEIKRTEDGGHMELQSLRYAAMVSSLRLDEVIQAYATTHNREIEAARNEILAFLQPSSGGEIALTGEVRIVLVSADFSTEVTTTVLWLTKRYELDITCIRLRPYSFGSETLIDSTQIIPLPESADYEVKKRAQENEQRKTASATKDVAGRFYAQLVESGKTRTPLFGQCKRYGQWMPVSAIRKGFDLNVVVNQQESRAECYIMHPDRVEARSNAAFHELRARNQEIHGKFGGELSWQELPGKLGCRICVEFPGGLKSPEAEWPELQNQLIDAVVRLEQSLKEPVLALNF